MSSELGVGFTYHPVLADFVAANADGIDLLEVDSSSWLGRSHEAALLSLERIPCARVVRGASLGGSRLADPSSVASLRDFAAAVGARWVTGSLNFHRARVEGEDFDTGIHLPLRQTVGGARLAAHSARSTAGELRAPLALEGGKNYLKARRDEISDGEFLAEVAEDADCGIVLDLGSLWINAANGRQPIAGFLDDFPLERVWEIRLGSGNQRNGYGFGSRPGAILQDIVDIAASLVPRLPKLRAIVLDIHPASVPRLGASGLSEQLRILGSLWGERRKGAGAPRRRRSSRWKHERGITPREWEDALGGLVVGKSVHWSLADELLQDPGLTVFRRVLSESRASMVARHLPLTSRLLIASSGTAFLRSLLEAYWRNEAPSPDAPIEALGFARHLTRLALEVPYLQEVLEYERAVIESYLDGEKRVVRFRHDPEVVLRALAKGRLPGGPRSGTFERDVASA
jgi:uncharacterized protein (UPF0276 family)